MENRSHAFAAGLFTLAFALIAAVAVWWFGQSRESTDTYILETRRNVNGLNIQATVRYRGIRAGKVVTIEPDESDPLLLLVTINLDSRFRLTKGTTAELGYQGVTGLAFVDLQDDGAKPEQLSGSPPRITLRPTMFDKLGDKAEGIVGQISDVSARLSKILDEKNAENISRTLDNMATASDGLKEMPKVVAAMREVLAEGNLKNLSRILAHVEKTAGETAPLTVEMRELVKSMSAWSVRLDQVASATGDETLPRVNALVRDLKSNSGQFSRLLDGLETHPQMLLFGKTSATAGPGESGFVAPPFVQKGK
jgi:phospholipid/cholesterol/gamma-HCH transport system substrate-binding protein